MLNENGLAETTSYMYLNQMQELLYVLVLFQCNDPYMVHLTLVLRLQTTILLCVLCWSFKAFSAGFTLYPSS